MRDLAIPLMITAALASPAMSQATFEFRSDLDSATDLSPDGRFVVGSLDSGGTYRLDLTTGEVLSLPPAGIYATAVSDDGRFVLGAVGVEIDGTTFQEAAIWSEESNAWSALGSLPVDGCDSSRSTPQELSADGSVAVGLVWVGCDAHGFRWTSETGMTALESLGNGTNRASVVSADGNLIGGFAQGSFNRTPTAWGPSGSGLLLDPPAGDAVGEIRGISDDGLVLLGEWNGDATIFRSGGSTREVIGTGSLLPGWIGTPIDIANDGTIVGFDTLGLNRRAWILPSGADSMIDLRDYLVGQGAKIPEGFNFEAPTAISIDGSIIIGHGFSGAWIMTLDSPSSCAADIAPPGGDGVVDSVDLGAILAGWGTPDADIDGDGTTTAADLSLVLAGWGVCPSAEGACCFGDGCEFLTAEACAALGGGFRGAGTPCELASCTVNDRCIDAIDVTDAIDGPPVEGDNTTATPGAYSGGIGETDMPVGSPSCQWSSNPGAAHSSVWYSFDAPESGAIRVQTCGSVPIPFQDSLITIFSGACGALVEIACDEDGCGPDSNGNEYFLSSVDAVGLVPGERYVICVMNSGDWLGSVPGPFRLTLRSIDGPRP